jgi:hypothetical protein
MEDEYSWEGIRLGGSTIGGAMVTMDFTGGCEFTSAVADGEGSEKEEENDVSSGFIGRPRNERMTRSRLPVTRQSRRWPRDALGRWPKAAGDEQEVAPCGWN